MALAVRLRDAKTLKEMLRDAGFDEETVPESVTLREILAEMLSDGVMDLDRVRVLLDEPVRVDDALIDRERLVDALLVGELLLDALSDGDTGHASKTTEPAVPVPGVEAPMYSVVPFQSTL